MLIHRKKYFIFSLFIILSLALAGLSFFRSQTLRTEDSQAMGFGISPPLITNEEPLYPGSRLKEKVALLRSENNKDQTVIVNILAPRIQSWITVSPSWSVTFPEGQYQLPVDIEINIPSNAEPGNYTGNISFVVQSSRIGPGVGIQVGARTVIDINIGDDNRRQEVISTSAAEAIIIDAPVEPAVLIAVDPELYKRLQGSIILLVEEKGEAWYVHPDEPKVYYLGRPQDAQRIMSEIGTGISDANLALIPRSIDNSLANEETKIGLPESADIVPAAVSEPEETKGFEIATLDAALSKRLKGKILLQVEQKGEAWYVYPGNLSRYYLGRPDDAFRVMRDLGLGVSNENFEALTK